MVCKYAEWVNWIVSSFFFFYEKQPNHQAGFVFGFFLFCLSINFKDSRFELYKWIANTFDVHIFNVDDWEKAILNKIYFVVGSIHAKVKTKQIDYATECFLFCFYFFWKICWRKSRYDMQSDCQLDFGCSVCFRFKIRFLNFLFFKRIKKKWNRNHNLVTAWRFVCICRRNSDGVSRLVVSNQVYTTHFFFPRFYSFQSTLFAFFKGRWEVFYLVYIQW